MAYKPPKQTIVDNDLSGVPSNEAVFEALKLKLDEPSVSGTNGQLLQLDGYVSGEPVTSWVNPPSPLPSQTGNEGKFLITNGTSASWDTVVNEAGNDLDFRVEGDTDANLLFIDASTDKVGIGTSTPAEKLDVAGAVLAQEFVVTNYRLDPHTHDEGTESGNFTINWANSPVQTVTLNAAGPLVITMNNPVNGGAYALRIIQGATPGTVTWPLNVKWPGGTPPTLSTTTGDVDIINFLYFNDGVGNMFYYGVYSMDFA